MIESIIRWSVENRFFVLLATLIVTGLGLYSVKNTPVDALPDLSARYDSGEGHSLRAHRFSDLQRQAFSRAARLQKLSEFNFMHFESSQHQTCF